MGSERFQTILARAALLGLLALSAAAGAEPAVQERPGPIWRAPGESLGLGTWTTLAVERLDARGSEAKLAEDEGLVDDTHGLILLNWFARAEDGRYGLLRLDANTDDEASGRALFVHEAPGRCRFRLRYNRLQHYDDPTTEDPYLPGRPGTPPETTANLQWQRARFDGSRRLGVGWRHVRGGYEYLERNGAGVSLSRGRAAEGYVYGVPGARDRDLATHRVWLGGDLVHGPWAFDWIAELQKDDGTRALHTTDRPTEDPGISSEITADDERSTWNLRLGATRETGGRWLLFGNYGYRFTKSEPKERRGPSEGYRPTTALRADETRVVVESHTALAGFLFHPRPWMRLRLATRIQQLEQDGKSRTTSVATNLAEKNASYGKDRFRQTYMFQVSHSGWRRTRLSADYRFEATDETANSISLEEYQDGNVLLRVQSGNRDRTVHAATIRLKERLNRRLSLSGRLAYRAEDVRQQDDTNANQYSQGDRNWRRMKWRLALVWRPRPRFSFEAGHRGITEEFEREDRTGAKTEWKSGRSYALATWQPLPRLSLFTNFSIGEEEYTIDGTLPANIDEEAAWNPVEYETESYRLAPGLLLHPVDKVLLEGHYERVRNRDSVANDSDRWYGRISFTPSPDKTVTLAYRRYEFDENLGDDYIADLYSLAMTAGF